MQQVNKCPECGTENPTNAKKCSSCNRELSSLLATTMTFIQSGQRVNDGPEQSEFEGLKDGEQAVLLVKKGPILGQRLKINDGDTIIGRDPKSNIFLNDITVSRRHAKIELNDNVATVKDLGSLNGTYLNNKRFTESKLNNLDELQIGKFLLVYLCK